MKLIISKNLPIRFCLFRLFAVFSQSQLIEGWVQQRLSLYAESMALRGGCYSDAKVRNIFDINIIYIGNFIEEGSEMLNRLTQMAVLNTNCTNYTNLIY